MNNIVSVKLDSRYASTLGVWQYDYGQVLRITGLELPPAVEVQFSLDEKSGETLSRVGTTVDGVTEVKIPDELLRHSATSNYRIYAYIYLTDETSGNTKCEITIPVRVRSKPTSPAEDPETDPDLFRETVVAVNASAKRAENAASSAMKSAASADETLAEIKRVADGISGNIENANTMKSELSDMINNAGIEKKELESSIGKAGEAKMALDSSIRSAGEKQLALDATVEHANTVDASLKEHIGSAEQIQENVEQIAKNKADISSLKEDLSNKITKFYASNQGENHLADSDDGKIQDMMLYGKSSQDGVPTPENPVEIKSVVNPTVKLLGSNILKIADCEYQDGGVTTTVSNGVVKLKGIANRYLDIQITANGDYFFKEGTKIIFSSNNVKGIENKNGAYLDFTNNNTIGFSIMSENINTPYIIKESDTKYSFILFIRCHAGETYDETWKPQVLIGETITPLKPYTEQTITLPITLNAIPVSSGGNVTIDGQQYIADYVDVERGKVVRMCERVTFNTKNGRIDEEYRLAFYLSADNAGESGDKECIFSTFKWESWETCVAGTSMYIKNIKKSNNELYTAQELKELSLDFYAIYQLLEQKEIDLTQDQIQAFKSLATNYPVTNIEVSSDQLDGYTVFNYPISMAEGWDYVKQQIGDTRDYIYDMDLQSAEAYVNSEYAVALTELEVM